MGNQENPQSQNRNRSEVDSSIGAKLAAKGIFVETVEATQSKEEMNKEIGELIGAQLLKKLKDENRNHQSNNRKAGPALVEALKDAGVVFAEERKEVRAQYNKEREILENEIKEAEINIREALTQKKGREAHNWEILLQKSKAILNYYEKSASFIDSDTGKDLLNSLHRYAKARYDQAQKELIADSFEATGKFIAQNQEDIGSQQPELPFGNIALDGTVFDDGIPVLVDVVSTEKLIPRERISSLKATPTETISYPQEEAAKLIPSETVSYPQEEATKLTPSERVSFPRVPKVAPSPFDLHRANRRMERDMDYLSRKTEEKLTPSETISYPQDVASTETTTNMEKFDTQTTGDNWQEEAFSRFELARFENEGGRTMSTLEAETTPVSQEETSVETKQTVATPEVAPLEGQKYQFKNLEEALNGIQRAKTLVAERELNLGEKTMGYIRGVGETWNKFPLRYKLLLSTGMLATGVGAAITGSAITAGAITALGAGIRAAGASAIFYAIETGLKSRAEKKGVERTNAQALRDSAAAAAISIFVMGVMPSVAGAVSDYAVEMFGSAEASEQAVKTGLEGAGATAPIVCAEIAQEGDTVWSMAERGISASLGEKFTSLSPEQQTYFIDAVKDQVVAHPDQFGLADANELQVGQGIDFGILLNNQEFMSETLAEAKGLSAEDIEGIRNYAGEELVDGGTAETTAGTPEALSTDPEVLAIAGELYHNHVNDVFGSKGFFGFGATDGLKSPNWADASLGFANKTVEEIMNTKPVVLPGDGALIGIEDRASTEKMQAYFNRVIIETGIQPEQGETAEKFLKRVSVLSVMHKG